MGAEFMLRAEITKINTKSKCIKVTDPDGTAHKISYKTLISDPSYFVDEKLVDCEVSKVKKEIIRCICICKKNPKAVGSRNVTFLAPNKKFDIFCVVLGPETQAAPENYEIAILSTVKETENIQQEIEFAIKKFDVVEFYVGTRVVYENSSKEVIFTENVDESPLMDNIYEDI